jgi:hypothetical protein
MSIEELKALEQRFYEECNKGEATAIALLDELFANDIVWHSATGQDVCGLENLKKSFSKAYNTFPDTHYTVDDIIAEGDKVVTRFTFSGTHKGKFGGIPPTNKKVRVWAISIAHAVDGKFVEVWER